MPEDTFSHGETHIVNTGLHHNGGLLFFVFFFFICLPFASIYLLFSNPGMKAGHQTNSILKLLITLFFRKCVVVTAFVIVLHVSARLVTLVILVKSVQ